MSAITQERILIWYCCERPPLTRSRHMYSIDKTGCLPLCVGVSTYGKLLNLNHTWQLVVPYFDKGKPSQSYWLKATGPRFLRET